MRSIRSRATASALACSASQVAAMPRHDSADLIATLRGLRQTRSYTTEPVDDRQLEAILEVARWTGSGGNRQPWRLVVVRDAEARAALSTTKADTGWLANA